MDGGRWYRPLAVGMTLLVLAAGLAIAFVQVRAFAERGLLGIDYRLFMEQGRRWAETGSMYLPYQLAGPYPFNLAAGTTDLERMPGLYPPPAGPVFAAWRFLPAFLWWAIPLGLLGYALVRLRPAPWAWPVMALPLLITSTASILAVGGSTMWVAAGVAAGLLWGWPVLVLALKPTFAPLLLAGAGHRSFWIVGAASLPLLLFDWGSYVTVVRNAESTGLFYSVRDIPFVLVPVIAYASRAVPARSLLAQGRRTSGAVTR